MCLMLVQSTSFGTLFTIIGDLWVHIGSYKWGGYRLGIEMFLRRMYLNAIVNSSLEIHWRLSGKLSWVKFNVGGYTLAFDANLTWNFPICFFFWCNMNLCQAYVVSAWWVIYFLTHCAVHNQFTSNLSSFVQQLGKSPLCSDNIIVLSSYDVAPGFQ